MTTIHRFTSQYGFVFKAAMEPALCMKLLPHYLFGVPVLLDQIQCPNRCKPRRWINMVYHRIVTDVVDGS